MLDDPLYDPLHEAEIQAPALLQETCTVDAPAALITDEVETLAIGVFGRGMKRIGPGLWRKRSLAQVTEVRIEERSNKSLVRASIAIEATPWRKPLAVAVGVLTVAMYIAAALLTLSDFRSRTTSPRVYFWVASLLLSLFLTPLALRLNTQRNQSAAAIMQQLGRFLLAVESIEPKRTPMRG